MLRKAMQKMQVCRQNTRWDIRRVQENVNEGKIRGVQMMKRAE